jgi:hypothetical protein
MQDNDQNDAGDDGNPPERNWRWRKMRASVLQTKLVQGLCVENVELKLRQRF